MLRLVKQTNPGAQEKPVGTAGTGWQGVCWQKHCPRGMCCLVGKGSVLFLFLYGGRQMGEAEWGGEDVLPRENQKGLQHGKGIPCASCWQCQVVCLWFHPCIAVFSLGMLWQIYNICPFNFLFVFGEIPNMVSLWLGKRQGNNLTRLRSNLARPFGDQAKGFLWVPVCWDSFSHLVAQSMFCFWRSPVSFSFHGVPSQ